MELSDVRRRLRGAIEEAKKRAAERRARADEASSAYETFLPAVAIPAFHAMSQALSGEGHRFKVLTPGRAVRLSSEFTPDDFLELALDTTADRPELVLTTSRGRGRRKVSDEHAVFAGRPIPELTQDDVIELLVAEIVPYVER
jgi:hypothetical protein